MKRIYPVLLVCISLTASCTSQLTIDSWKNPDYDVVKINKILCCAVVKDPEYKRQYENMFSYIFESENIVSYISVYYQNKLYDSLLQNIDGVLKENNFDFLITIKYRSDKRVPDFKRITYSDYLKAGLHEISKPGYTETHRNSEVEIILFAVNNKKPVWSAVIQTLDANEFDTAVALAQQVLYNLYRDDILVK